MPEANEAAPAYEAGAEYTVALTRPAKVAGVDFLPRHQHTMTGAFLTRLIEENGADAVDSATLAR